MALFPAYKSEETSKGLVEEESASWLHNESCPPEVAVTALPLSVSHSVGEASEGSEILSRDELEKCIEKWKKKKKEKKKKERKDSNNSAKGNVRIKKSKSHKRKRSIQTSESSDEKISKFHRKHHRKHKKHSSESDTERESAKYFVQIPTHDGRNKNIFADGPLQLMRAEDVMYIDRAPDKNNSIFSTIHYSQVSSYSKLSSLPMGCCSPLTSVNKKKKSNRYFQKAFHNALQLVPVHKLTNEDFNKEYIPLELTYGEEQKIKEIKERLSENSLSHKLGILDSTTVDYIHGRGKGPQEDASLKEDPEKKYWQEQIKSYNERLAKEPHNIPLWLEFVDIQDKAIAFIFDADDPRTLGKTKNVKHLTERKISLLESAIKKNIRSIELHVKRLHLGEDIWDNKKLNLEWNKLVSNFPNNIDIWLQFLIFHQTYFPVFDLDHVVNAFAKCTQNLVQMQEGTFVSHRPPDNIGHCLIDLTTQLAFIWYQAGYMERSVALFQALIELNMFRPRQLKGDDGKVTLTLIIDLFEAFWDSKAPRFGEKDSVGWAKFMEKREPVTFLEEIVEGTQDEEDEILLNGGSKHQMWINLESSRERNHWFPFQQDPDYCEDVERMVSFSILKRHLFLISAEEETVYLLIQFLNFLGVSVPDCFANDVFPLPHDKPFYPLRLESLRTFITRSNFTSAEDKLTENLKQGLFDFPVIGASIWEPKSESYFTFVCEVVKSSMDIIPNLYKSKFAILYIGLLTDRCVAFRESDQLLGVIKSCKKNIKNILKMPEFRSDLDVYFEYARFEASCFAYKDAIKIHSTALSLGLSQAGADMLSGSSICDVLWRHLISLIVLQFKASEKLIQKNVNFILNASSSVLLENRFVASEEQPNGAHILRAKAKLTSLLELQLNNLDSYIGKNTPIQYFVALLAIFKLVTGGFKAGCSIFEDCLHKIKKFKLKSFSHEILNTALESEKVRTCLSVLEEKVYEYYLWVVDSSQKLSNIFPCLSMAPSSVRNILKSALSVSPNNLCFLRNFAKYQNWRDILCERFVSTETEDFGIVFLVFRLLPHIKKVTNMIESSECGTMGCGYQLENILEKAVSSTPGRNCPLLWRLYLRLIRATKPTKVKDVAYRALNSCPSAKCLYIDLIRLCPETMQDMLKLMTEKKIRIRLPLEELEVLLEEEKEDEEEDNVNIDNGNEEEDSEMQEHGGNEENECLADKREQQSNENENLG